MDDMGARNILGLQMKSNDMCGWRFLGFEGVCGGWGTGSGTTRVKVSITKPPPITKHTF